MTLDKESSVVTSVTTKEETPKEVFSKIENENGVWLLSKYMFQIKN